MRTNLHLIYKLCVGLILTIFFLFTSQSLHAQGHSSLKPIVKFGIGMKGLLYHVEGYCDETWPKYIQYDHVAFTLWKKKTEVSVLFINDFGRFGLGYQDKLSRWGQYDAFTFDLGINLLSMSRRLRKEYFFGPGIALSDRYGLPPDKTIVPCYFIGGKNFEFRFEYVIKKTGPFTQTSLTYDIRIQKENIYALTFRYYFPINFKKKLKQKSRDV
jgi:hypothetical protein